MTALDSSRNPRNSGPASVDATQPGTRRGWWRSEITPLCLGSSEASQALAQVYAVAGSREHQCRNFTGMRLVFGDILISFGVVWYSGMRKWYAGFSVVVAAVGVVPGAKPCKSAGITRVYPGFSRYTRKIPGILPILPILPPRRHSDSL